MTLSRWLGSHRVELLECASTNDEAARLARAGARHGTIVIAESQTAGRGREGRTWVSPRGAGMYLSAVVRPPLPLDLVPPMTLAIGVGLCDAIRTTGAPAELKWPNDVLVNGRKLAGVLVEAQSQGTRLEAVIVGIGVNVCPWPLEGEGELSGGLAQRVISVEEAAGHTIDRANFVATVLEHVEHWIDRYIAAGLLFVIPAWQDRMARNLVARAGSMTGELAGLDPDGALLLRDDTGQLHRVWSGDVEVIHATPAAEAIVATC
jgi:BirA family biotin operon repressor/biotin-[acetyl-CoA-carboxylase] ligase